METFANELSFSRSGCNKLKARENMRSLIDVLRSAHRSGVERTLRTIRNFTLYEISPGYPLAAWLSDREVELEQRQFFKTIAAKAPYAEDVFKAVQDELGEEFICEFDHEPAVGFGAAFLTDSITVSYADDERFRIDPARVQIIATSGSELKEFEAEICSLSDSSQVTARSAWFESHLRPLLEVVSGQDLVNRQQSVFPQLVFCDGACESLARLTGNENYFRHVLRHLRTLNESIAQWEGVGFPHIGVRWSNESESTMQNANLVAMRTFRCPDGRMRVMEPHTKLIGANIRIHFVPDASAGIAYVGYVGPHLPT